jgi:hypothetical protein
MLEYRSPCPAASATVPYIGSQEIVLIRELIQLPSHFTFKRMPPGGDFLSAAFSLRSRSSSALKSSSDMASLQPLRPDFIRRGPPSPATPVFFRLASHCRRHRVLDLEPVRRAAGPISLYTAPKRPWIFGLYPASRGGLERAAFIVHPPQHAHDLRCAPLASVGRWNTALIEPGCDSPQ